MRHPTPSEEELEAAAKVFSDVASRTKNFSPTDAWRAFRCLCDAQGEHPGKSSSAVAFVANLTSAVVNGADGSTSAKLLRMWGERIEGMLHLIDLEDETPESLLRVRWNTTLISAAALQGKLDDAIPKARAMLSRRDVDDAAQHEVLKCYILELYTAMVEALRHHRGATAVFDFLAEDLD